MKQAGKEKSTKVSFEGK